MPPPPADTPLDPSNDPATSPWFTAKTAASGIAGTFTDSRATNFAKPSKAVTQIPPKFRAAAFSVTHRDGRSPTQPLRALNTITTRTLNRIKNPTAAPTHGMPKTPAQGGSLPALPKWLLGILAGTLSFLLIVAVVLFFAQFPRKLGWPGKIKHWKSPEYERVRQDEDKDEDEDDLTFDPINGRRSARATAHENHIRVTSDSLRRRKPRNLSIDTSLASRGLGIATMNDEAPKTPRKRRSYDEEALSMRPKSPARVVWESFTAPLPSTQTFTGRHHSTPPNKEYDAESGLLQPPPIQVSTPDLFDFASQYHRDGDAEVPGSALFKKINGGIYHVADRLSRTFYDQVTGPEEGLMLPVHNGEREQPVMPGIFVD